MASSSASPIHKSFKYDVFLSFRGEDTRKTFVDHLYVALQRQGIQTYKDDERIEQGENISDELIKSIEDSKFFIIVFSKNYASSAWCLEELVKIMECQKTTEQKAYPVFYDVEPSEIRKQSGPVGKAFAKHKDEMAAGKWREALENAANLAGWELKNTTDGHEAKFIQKIIEHISLELHSINLSSDENLIGMETRIKNVESSLEIGIDDVRMIGIKGIGGGGKTTLARAIFDKLCIQFEGKSFLENVREVSKTSGLKKLQKQVLLDVTKEQRIIVNSVHEGKNMMKMRLRAIKVLLVLDDVDHISQLEALAGAPNWLRPGSRIIITTRDEQVLKAHRVNWIHDVNLLTKMEAICLFSRYAFGTNIPVQGYERLSGDVVNYASGLPLTIKVLGSFLCGKDELEWEDALERLKTIPEKETLEKLELSYISLEDDYKEIFLDVACFMKGLRKNDVIRLLVSCGFHARNGLRVLEQKSLITINKYQNVGMHDLIQEMGRNIVRRLHPYEPNKHSRLWIREEILDILANDMGTEATRCIQLPLVPPNPEIYMKGLAKMVKLRYLELETQIGEGYFNCQYFPSSIRLLFWDGYPGHWCLPKTFGVYNLVSLEMPNSNIEQLWQGGERKVLKSLRFLDLQGSKLKTLDLELTPNLERLNLALCYDLVEVRAPVGCLKSLVDLNLCLCRRLRSAFSFIKQLESTGNLHKFVYLNLCNLSLREFPEIAPGHSNNSFVELDFSYNDIEELPESIGNLHKLVYLNLNRCRKLKGLPVSFCSLQHLRFLYLKECGIEELPEDLGCLECLEILNISNTHVKCLPDSICMLKHLRELSLDSCKQLGKLPESIGDLRCLEKLNLSWSSISHLPQSISLLKGLKISAYGLNDQSIYTPASTITSNTSTQVEPALPFSMVDSEKHQILNEPIHRKPLKEKRSKSLP